MVSSGGQALPGVTFEPDWRAGGRLASFNLW